MNCVADHNIRTYASTDRDALLQLVRELQMHEVRLFDRMKPADQIGAEYIAGLNDQCSEHDGEILVAEMAGRIVGYAAVMKRIRQTDPDETDYVYADVFDLAVTEQARGTGIGGALLNACEGLARQAGTRWLRISVLAKNNGALALYRKFGFREHLIQLEKPLS